MGQTDYTENFVQSAMNYLRSFADQLPKAFQSGASSGALGWFAANWIKILLVLVVAGIVIDWVVWMARWRPHWLWFRKKRIILDDDYDDLLEDEYDDDAFGDPFDEDHAPRFRSSALQRKKSGDEDDEWWDDESDDEFFDDAFEDDEYDDDDEEHDDEYDDEWDDEYDEDPEPPAPVKTKNPAAAARDYAPPAQEEDEFADFDDDEYAGYDDDSDIDDDDMLIYARESESAPTDLSEVSELSYEDLVMPYVSASDSREPAQNGEADGWRTGYTGKTPVVESEATGLSRRARRELKQRQSEDE